MPSRLMMIGLLVLTTLSTQIACDGWVGVQNQPPVKPPVDKNNSNPPDTNNTPVVYQPFKAPSPKLRRLSLFEYTQTIATLVGPGVVIPDDLEPDTPINGLNAVGSSTLVLSSTGVAKYEAAAISVAEQVMRDKDKRFRIVPCQPVKDGRACAQMFVESFGKKAWRRPMTPDEVTRYTDVAMNTQKALGDFWTGLEFAMIGLLQSPYFIYRVELGASDPTKPERYRLTPYEVATRLSYLIWGTTPDEELLILARDGGLDSPLQIKSQAEKMLADARARVALKNFWVEHFELYRIKNISKDKTLFPLMTPTLGAAMVEETLRTMDYLVFDKNADIREMFKTRETFINPELSALYGVSIAKKTSTDQKGFEAFTHPTTAHRQGILTHASILAINAHPVVTSPAHRGLFVRRNLMCKDVPPPPDDVSTELPSVEPTDTPQTLRQRIEGHIFAQARCKGCHIFMDEIGFGLEHFDAIGQYRTKDTGIEINAKGSLDGVPFDDARGLSDALFENKGTMNCLTRRAYRYAVGHIESVNEEVVIAKLQDKFAASGYRFDRLIVEIVGSDGFLYVQPPQQDAGQ